MKILILSAAILTASGCATAITSYHHTSYDGQACPLEVKADTSMGASVHINERPHSCEQLYETGE